VSIDLRSGISDLLTDFLSYRVDWEEGRIVWYPDDIETARLEGNQVSDEQMYIIANLAVREKFPESADSTIVFPAKFEIDCMRVYQR
jgi:beta-glucanase (GH16 family)